MKKELEQQIKIQEQELVESREKLNKINTCQHVFVEVETGEGGYDDQCYKCLILKSELSN
jgi:hypothetical protein